MPIGRLGRENYGFRSSGCDGAWHASRDVLRFSREYLRGGHWRGVGTLEVRGRECSGAEGGEGGGEMRREEGEGEGEGERTRKRRMEKWLQEIRESCTAACGG